MFNFKKKKNLSREIPTAEEMREKTYSNLTEPTLDQIMKTIEDEASKGFKDASFFMSYINDEIVSKLESHGYKVRRSTHNCSPCFYISW